MHCKKVLNLWIVTLQRWRTDSFLRGDVRDAANPGNQESLRFRERQGATFKTAEASVAFILPHHEWHDCALLSPRTLCYRRYLRLYRACVIRPASFFSALSSWEIRASLLLRSRTKPLICGTHAPSLKQANPAHFVIDTPPNQACPMRWKSQVLPLLVISTSLWTVYAHRNSTDYSLARSPFSQIADDRPDGCPECPRCFDCQYEEFACTQFAECSKRNGKCSCPPGFGGDDCSEPLCGSLADGKDRSPRQGQYCDCKE